MSSQLLSANNLRVSYGDHLALKINNLSISSDAGIVGVFGPNGAGKSTLLRTIVGDISTFEGSVVRPQRSCVSYLPDQPFLYPWLSVEQCASLFESRYHDFRRDVFEEFLQGSSLTPSRRVRELSKGMSERLHLALAISRAPDLYVFDEPLGGVDPLTRDLLLDLIKCFRAPESTLLLSTHLINGIDRVFDQVLLIADGRLLAHDNVANLRALGDGDLELAYKKKVIEA